MKGKDFLDKMGLMDFSYVEAADTKPARKKNTWIKWCATAACLCLIIGTAAMIPLSRGSHGEPQVGGFVLSEKTTAKVSLGYDEGAATSSDADLEFLTEEEMFAHEKMYVFRGKVGGLTNVTLDFNGITIVRCIATVSIEEVYKGNIVPGDQITMLIPCGINLRGVWVEDTDIITQLESGMEGIFMPWVYDEDSYFMLNGAVLMEKDLAECGLLDGMRWAFLSTDRGVIFDKSAYPGACDVTTMDDMEAYVVDMLKQFGN